jgi:hypothetical protein
VKRYQYYFDTSEIKRYKDVAVPLKTREFGCELSPNFNELSNTKEGRVEAVRGKCGRSLFSQTSGERGLRLCEEELKGRILSYL